MKNTIELIKKLPYDLKVLIYKIYILNNPEIIIDIYFNDNLLSKNINIEYTCVNLGTYYEKKKIFTLNKLLFQYELFKKKYKDLGENTINNFIKYLEKQSKIQYKDYNTYFNRLYQQIDYTYEEICSVNLCNYDLVNEGWEYDYHISNLIFDNNILIQKYIEELKNYKKSIYIIYKL